MSGKSNIFVNEDSQSAIQIIRETMTVSLDDNGTPIVSFAMNRGKGTGAQVMAVADFAEYVSTLEHFASNGIDEAPSESLSPTEMVRSTIAMSDEGIVSFRVKGGKGAKPAKVSAAEFSEVVSLLSDTVENVTLAANSLSISPDDE